MLRYEKNEGRRMVVGVIRTPDRNVVMCVKEPLDVTFYASREEVLNSPIDEVRQHSPSMAFEMGLEGATPTVQISGEVSQACLMGLTHLSTLKAGDQKRVIERFNETQKKWSEETCAFVTKYFFILCFLGKNGGTHTVISDYSKSNVEQAIEVYKLTARNGEEIHLKIRDELFDAFTAVKMHYGTLPTPTQKIPFLSCRGPIAELIGVGMCLSRNYGSGSSTDTTQNK